MVAEVRKGKTILNRIILNHTVYIQYMYICTKCKQKKPLL